MMTLEKARAMALLMTLRCHIGMDCLIDLDMLPPHCLLNCGQNPELFYKY